MLERIKHTAGVWVAMTLAAALAAGLAVTNLSADQETAAKADKAEGLDDEALAPAPEHLLASRLATRFVSGYHYHRNNLDEDISARIFDQYFKLLDPNRMYFTAADLDDFERYRPHMEKALKSSDLDPAFDVFNRYVKRVNERVDFARERLAEGFDFTEDETFYFDRSEADWADDDAALEAYWTQRVKNDYLRLKLADKEADEIKDTLGKRYTGLARRISELNAEDVFQFFMNAYTRSIEPHSSYLSPRSVENFEISMRLSLDGIGALLQRETEYTSIVEVIPGGPADLDGRLQEGDRIVGVAQDDEDMVDVVGWRLDDVVALIRGERETKVRLEVLPAESGLSGPPTTIELVRNEVKLEEQAASSEVISHRVARAHHRCH
jgi:carboxyl-terminal processing protease